ncbi:universal stress protein [Olleya sp. Bg11-27]|uniref:universal stress protein n=1 Tax=Olleya sp. Bg11-27 TaxID=2058135 RepID=UPI000C301989|nr:hypothetical protein [Olleya sp. Bg11-27]AUC76967.1 hypothetical protein CW732_15290 [Olleya sp. Bg11-27]
MKKILIPIDFTLNSFQTIDYVLDLFKDEACDFYILNTYTYNTNSLDAIQMLQVDDDWFEQPKQQSIRQLGTLVERYTLNLKYVNHRFYAVSECLSLLDAIKKCINTLSIDLIILTSKKENNIGKKTKNIVDKIRSCPVLLVPPHASACKKNNLTIASDFKEKINPLEINKFLNILENTNLQITILVLGKQNTLSANASDNLETILKSMQPLLRGPIQLHYAGTFYKLKDYARAHLDGIMCIVDKKPDVFRKIGLFHSNIFSTLKQLRANTVLTIHQ